MEFKTSTSFSLLLVTTHTISVLAQSELTVGTRSHYPEPPSPVVTLWANPFPYLSNFRNSSYGSFHTTPFQYQVIPEIPGELVQGKRLVGRPKLRFKDVAKRDMQAIGLPIDSWETIASDRSAWKTNCTEALREGEKLLHITVDTRRERQKARALAPPTDSTYVCGSCHRTCRSRIRLQSHLRKCLRKCTITNTCWNYGLDCPIMPIQQ